MALRHVRSQLFTRRDYANLVNVIADGFTHDELTMQANVHDISGDPGKDSATKPQRANALVETLLERRWPDGDESLLDILNNAKENRSWEEGGWVKSRDALWKVLSSKSDLVFDDEGVWRLRSDVRDTETEPEPTSVAPNGPNPVWSIPAPLSNEGSASVTPQPALHSPTQHSGPPRVFVVQGRDQGAADQVLHFLRGVHLIPLEWEEVKDACELHATTMDIVRKGLEMAQIIVVVLSGDDMAMLRDELQNAEDGEQERQPTPQPRQNVLLEAGMALAMAPKQTVLVRTNKLREISDLSGINWITMKGTEDARLDFANALKKALTAAGVADPLSHAPNMWNRKALGEFSASAR